MTDTEFDLFVIGGGSGGVRAARVAARHGARVAIAEEHRFGGTCVIRGCVPKKLLVYASRFPDEFAHAKSFGWSFGEAAFSWPALIAAKDTEIARLEQVYADNLSRAGVRALTQRAVLDGVGRIRLADGTAVRAAHTLIATGGTPWLDPDVPGIEHCISSNEIFHLPDLPPRLVVIGGGYIACEFASLMNGLGAEVTQVYRGTQLLRGFDEDLRGDLASAMAARGVRILTGRTPRGFAKDGALVTTTLDDGSTLPAEAVLCATGRRPNVADLGLDAAGVRTGPGGRVIVDADARTTAAGVYAVGDVTDRVNLTPVAIREGQAFADTVFGGARDSVSHEGIPTAVFTTPEVGTVGPTEAQARERGHALSIFRSRFRPLKDTLGGGEDRMLMKMIVDRDDDRVLGVHLLGPDAAEMIQLLAVPVRMGAKKSDFDATMALHPTAAEELVTMAKPDAD